MPTICCYPVPVFGTHDSSGLNLIIVFGFFHMCSDKLRHALNLSSTDYPLYIRRMILHGYPPGYRLLATETHLTLIDSESPVSLQDSRHGQTARELSLLVFHQEPTQCSSDPVGQVL